MLRKIIKSLIHSVENFLLFDVQSTRPNTCLLNTSLLEPFFQPTGNISLVGSPLDITAGIYFTLNQVCQLYKNVFWLVKEPVFYQLFYRNYTKQLTLEQFVIRCNNELDATQIINIISSCLTDTLIFCEPAFERQSPISKTQRALYSPSAHVMQQEQLLKKNNLLVWLIEHEQNPNKTISFQEHLLTDLFYYSNHRYMIKKSKQPFILMDENPVYEMFAINFLGQKVGPMEQFQLPKIDFIR